jgi:putative SOS response-associated peptidase YedK
VGTTVANELLKDVHNRIPVILTRDAETAWLDPKTHEPERLLLLRQCPSDEMDFYPLSREVNSPAADNPSTIELIDTKR